ncbi:MAG: hypothetical protein M1819_001031 [Sarea resinae]|nr:MAG: hypothetical protein M1819_001031 [Sarea resinae]
MGESNVIPPPMDDSVVEHVQRVWVTTKGKSPLYDLLLQDIVIFSAARGYVQARIQVQHIHVNSKGTLHGTISACLVDWAGSMAIASYGRDKTGLSTDIHIQYVSGAKEGDWLEVEGRASKVGGTIAFTTATIRKIVDYTADTVVATGTHTKYVKQ